MVRFEMYKRPRTPSQVEWVVDAFIDEQRMAFWYVGPPGKGAIAHIRDQYPDAEIGEIAIKWS